LTREAAMAAFAKNWLAAGVKGADRPAGGSIQNESHHMRDGGQKYPHCNLWGH
jgi:hypothetical protein